MVITNCNFIISKVFRYYGKLKRQGRSFMDGKTTVKYLQNYIKEKDYKPELKKDYFLKLSEEVGELAKSMRKDVVCGENGSIKGTIDEELWDVIYYALAIANCYDIDMERTIKIKEEINNKKYNTGIEFEENR